MKIGVLTYHTENISEWANRTANVKRNYCKKNGYDFILETEFETLSRPASWAKIRLTEKHLPNFDWLFVTGADMLFLNDTRLETFIDEKYDMIIVKDYNISNEINADAFFIRNCEWAYKFLNEVWNRNNTDPWWEQRAMIDSLSPENLAHIKIVRDRPERCFNTFVPDYQEGDFVIHFAGSPAKSHDINKWIVERGLNDK
jgi:hypothetical protein